MIEVISQMKEDRRTEKKLIQRANMYTETKPDPEGQGWEGMGVHVYYSLMDIEKERNRY